MSMWAKEGTPAGDLFNLISDYFDAGYLEGKEGRSMDTPDRKADRISSAIHEHLQRYAALVERVEELEGEINSSNRETLDALVDCGGSEYHNGYLEAQNAELTIERNRYREALKRIAQVRHVRITESTKPTCDDIARQALRGEGE